jgi:hypothetical protein
MGPTSWPGAAVMIVISWLVLIPALTLVHELGHAIAGRLSGEKTMRVRLGSRPPRWRLRLAGIEVGVRPVQGFARGYYFPETATTRRAEVITTLGGPVMSLACAVSLALAAAQLGTSQPNWPQTCCQWLAGGAFIQLAWTAAPVRRYPLWLPRFAGHASDMYRALRALRAVPGAAEG